MTTNSQQPTTLLDRLGVVFLAALTSFATGILVWWVAGYALWRFDVYVPFWMVLGFVAVMTSLAALMQQDFLAGIFSLIWKWLHRLAQMFSSA